MRVEAIQDTYDAVVVGSGVCGGWAAKVLSEAGMSVLVLEAGAPIDPLADLLVASEDGPVSRRQGLASPEPRPEERRPLPRKHNGVSPLVAHLLIDETKHPFSTPEGKPFHWFRTHVVGGRSLLWVGRAFRLSDLDFKAASRDGHGIDWPLSYAELAPYYDEVEQFIGVTGSYERIDHLPDGVFLPPPPLTQGEELLRAAVERRWPGRRVIPSRGVAAGIPTSVPGHTGPWPRWSSNGSTLAAALSTGRTTVRTGSVVSHVKVDPKSGKAACLEFVDSETGRWMEARGRIFILAASTLASTRILLNSKSARHPSGLGNDHGVLGRYLADHGAVTVSGVVPTLSGMPNGVGRDGSNSICIPRFRNVTEEADGFLRSFLVQGQVQRREPWSRASFDPPWFSLTAVLEMLPRETNVVTLDEARRDAFGIPILRIECEFSENERRMASRAMQDLDEMATEAGFVVERRRPLGVPGSFVHEVGTARMGDDPKSSVVDPYNRCWAVPNLYVMDGAAFPSLGGPHPTLTMMALTVRACRRIIERSRALD